MITLQQIDNNTLMMQCNYAYKDRCKSIPWARFNGEKKSWVAPVSSLSYIQQEFKGEIYYKTPLWKIMKQPAPEAKPREYLGPEPQVSELKIKPYPYQEDGIKFMIDRLENIGFVLNGDTVGLGKTIQSIGVMRWYAQHGASKFLIICKKSIKSQWAREIRKFTDWDIDIAVTGKTPKKRQKAYHAVRNGGILITNYHNYLNDYESIKNDYDLCIIDEAHCVKARTGKMNQNIGNTIRGHKTVLLTGTPIMSRPDDIYGIVHLANEQYFGTYKDFKKRYIVTEWGIYGEQIIGAVNLDELQAKIHKFYISRTPEEVNLQLPVQRPAKVIECEMDAVQKTIQNAINKLKSEQDDEKSLLVDKAEMDPEARMKIEELNELGKMFLAALQFTADDPAVFRYLQTNGGINARFRNLLPKKYKMSEKTEATIDAVSEIIDADEKVIVFCHFASSARMLKDHFDKIAGANSVMYTGSVSDEQRELNLDAFNNNPETRVLIGTEAMAEGLNLQVARNVIHYEQADTYAQRTQRNGRIRRIGSLQNSINVIDIVTKGSFDEVKINKLKRDKELAETLLA